MAQVVAVHQIEVTLKPGKARTATERAQPPVTKTIKPGTAFDSTMLGPDHEDEYIRLKGRGAIRDWGTKGKPLVENDKTILPADAGGEDDVVEAKSAKTGKAGKRASTRTKKGGEKGVPEGDDDDLV